MDRGCDNVNRDCCNINRVTAKNSYEIKRVPTHNEFNPLKVTLSPEKILSTELDAEYPKFTNQPVNNKAGPKRVETKGKRVYKKMIDIAEKEECSQIIAPVMKTQEKTIAPVSKRAGLCTMRFHVTDATKNLASVKR